MFSLGPISLDISLYIDKYSKLGKHAKSEILLLLCIWEGSPSGCINFPLTSEVLKANKSKGHQTRSLTCPTFQERIWTFVDGLYLTLDLTPPSEGPAAVFCSWCQYQQEVGRNTNRYSLKRIIVIEPDSYFFNQWTSRLRCWNPGLQRMLNY